MKEKILYGLKLKEKDELLRLEKIYNGNDRYACNENKYYLTDEEGYPEFLSENKDDMINIIENKNMRTEWYNSTEKDPVISFDLDELEIVKIIVNYEII